MKASSLVQACENPWATVRMAQLCSVMRQLPSSQALGVGQVAVLVEDGGERGHLLVEGEVRRAWAARRPRAVGGAARTARRPGWRPGRPGSRAARW